ncbi:Ig-like domain-containing protein [Spirulina subsalsa FACHB-351]|uniref:Ig-like domain-containing protein n=1 Tax=Spirulina subsalsa FACHB-351 TaxID=234711 RepID=A0ABT3L0K5_9CYAN|nr:Ig-like domain-containing protein [Spirulina subsalsa]MCW6035036.1 Ig-like domain-containing protein [Spirulina subsalsa FACHB-351]
MTIPNRYPVLYPIDRISLGLMTLFSVVIGLLILGGSFCTGERCLFHTGPRVNQFSWENRVIDYRDQAFILGFNRPMDQESVEENIKITIPDQPDVKNPLPGKTSWAGRRMAYTLDFPAPYGTKYRFELENAQERFINQQQEGAAIQPYQAEFRTPDRALAYIGLEGAERGRLVIFDFTTQEKRIITPEQLVVTEFRIDRDRAQIVFSAVERNSTREGILDQQIYRVNTGLTREKSGFQTGKDIGKIDLILDNEGYNNLKFDLSEDGELLAVQRVNKEDPADFGLWVIQDGKQPKPLKNEPGGLFLIAPDNETIASTQGEGIAILSLEPAAQPLDFLAQFGMVLGFSPDGRSAAMVDFNKNNPDLLYTRSLYLVNNQGVQEKIFDTQGSILDCQFQAKGEQMFCLMTNLVEDTEYIEQPYIAMVDVREKKVAPLITLPKYQDINISLAPDGLGLLFDQIRTDPTNEQESFLKTSSGEALLDGQIWLLIPPRSLPEQGQGTSPQLEELPFVGFQPRWFP